MCSVLQWNCQGYGAKYEDLRTLLYDHHPVIAMIQETMLGSKVPRAPAGYTIYTTDGDRAVPGEGLACLIKNGTPNRQIHIQTRFPNLIFQVRMSRLYTICNLYLPHHSQVTSNDLLNIARQLPHPFIICGDFNGKHPLWGNQEVNARGEAIEEFLISSTVSLLNTGLSTHFHVQSGTTSAIDLSLCSSEVAPFLEWSTTVDLHGSDHWPVLINEIDCEVNTREPRYLLHKADWKRFTDETYVYPFDELINISPIEELVSFYSSILISAADLTIPKSSEHCRPRQVPWWTRECQQSVSDRKRALRRYKTSGLVVDKISYCRARAHAKRTLHTARVESWKRYVSSLNDKTPMSKIWKRIRKIRGSYSPINSPILTDNGDVISESIEVAERLADHYQFISSNNHHPNHYRRMRQLEVAGLDFESREIFDYNEPFSLQEINVAIHKCKNTAPGEDQIHYKFIKHSNETCRQFLLAIMNRIWVKNEYPTTWKRSIIISFLKPGKPASDVQSYRPVSLTSCVSKLMEKMVNTRLIFELEKRKLLPNTQFGFRKMQSTMDALVRVTTDIQEALNKKKNVLCVSFDIQKAYDTTWRFGILRTLHQFGFRGALPMYIQNFLSSRLFKTKVGSNFSSYHTQEQGVPQGSVISCTLFSLAINGILDNIPQDVKKSLYVDDLLIYVSGSYMPGLERRLQSAINSANSWANENGLRFSPAKSVAIHFHRKRTHQTPMNLRLGNSILPNVDSIKYLGMTLDKKLSWKQHIKDLKNNCVKRLDLLKHLSNTNWGAHRTIMLRLYRSIIRSKLDYGCFLYDSACRSTLRSLDAVHHAAIRLCTGAYRTSPRLYAAYMRSLANHLLRTEGNSYYCSTT